MKRLLFENSGLKISALLLSVFLWLFVTWRGQSEISLEVPPEFKNVPVGLGIVSNSARTVVVTIRGQERLMKNLKPSDIRVFVDLAKAKKGEGIYHISKEDIKLPYAMSVINILPSSLKIRVDETVSKTVMIKPAITGVPEKGFSVRSIEMAPRSVTVHGLRTEMRKVNALNTEVLDITGLNESVSQELNIDFGGANITADVSTVKLKVVITGRK